MVAYADRSTPQIKLAHWDGANWDYKTVFETSSNDVYFPSLMLDQTDVPHIAFTSDDNDYHTYIEYAQLEGDAWSVEEISPTISIDVAMTLDS